MQDLTTDQARQLLSEAMVAHLGVIDHGEPYVTPISFVVSDNAICVRTGGGRRVDAIADNPRVCVEASEFDVDSGNWQSAIAWGEAELMEDDAGARDIVLALMDKYRTSIGSSLSPGGSFPGAGVIIRIPIDRITGRASGSFFSVRTRPGRL
ncbi:MAG TPA: pyridoxamine 5'-phosphate oxidase family protein [Acidimicrobiia bacterium]|nr:pyridoxamine 5'-phosphate oxidase family protein [Acidimicrobiia bacterium]